MAIHPKNSPTRALALAAFLVLGGTSGTWAGDKIEFSSPTSRPVAVPRPDEARAIRDLARPDLLTPGMMPDLPQGPVPTQDPRMNRRNTDTRRLMIDDPKFFDAPKPNDVFSEPSREEIDPYAFGNTAERLFGKTPDSTTPVLPKITAPEESDRAPKKLYQSAFDPASRETLASHAPRHQISLLGQKDEPRLELISKPQSIDPTGDSLTRSVNLIEWQSHRQQITDLLKPNLDATPYKPAGMNDVLNRSLDATQVPVNPVVGAPAGFRTSLGGSPFIEPAAPGGYSSRPPAQLGINQSPRFLGINPSPANAPGQVRSLQLNERPVVLPIPSRRF